MEQCATDFTSSSLPSYRAGRRALAASAVLLIGSVPAREKGGPHARLQLALKRSFERMLACSGEIVDLRTPAKDRNEPIHK